MSQLALQFSKYCTVYNQIDILRNRGTVNQNEDQTCHVHCKEHADHNILYMNVYLLLPPGQPDQHQANTELDRNDAS